MKKLRVLNLILGVFLVGSLFLGFTSSTPVSADEPDQIKTTEIENLPVNSDRLDPYTVTTEVSRTEEEVTYTTEISSLPETLQDNKTLITCEWLSRTGIDGVAYFETGNNLFYAKVTGSRVTTQFNGTQSAWSPKVYLGNSELKLIEGPTVVADIYNPNYTGNTMKWVYSIKHGGFLGIGSHTTKITRYVRQIEGILQEFYVLTENPGNSIRIENWYDKELGYTWADDVFAYDANYTNLPIQGDSTGKTLSKDVLKTAVYPVIIDPSNSFVTSSSDGMIWNYDASISTCRTAASGDLVFASYQFLYVLYAKYGAGYEVGRSYLYFDTSSVPVDATVTDAYLYIYPWEVDSDIWDMMLHAYTGGTTYPHDPLVVGDFNIAQYTRLGTGSMYLSSDSIGHYNYLNGLGAGVTPGGTTKLMLTDYRDTAGATPSTYNEVLFYSYEQGSGYQPFLTVYYTIPVTVPVLSTSAASSITDTSALLSGGVTSDGGAAVSARFDYGTTTAYGSSTTWQSGLTTSSTFQATVNGLLQGTLYYFESEGYNSAGSNTVPSANVLTFLTLPSTTGTVTVTPGNTNNSLSWTKGTGATKTLVRFKTTGYPTSVSDGTSIYSSTGTSYVHSSLTNGVTYYYSVWSIAEGGGLTQYSTDAVHATGVPYFLGAPSVNSYAATNVSQTGALLHGSLVSYQGTATADVWFQYYTGAGTWTDFETTPDTMTSPALGSFSKAISGLAANTSYHCRAAALNTEGTTYGVDIPFVTGSPSAPTMSITVTGVSKTSAVLTGTVVDYGGASVTAWFEWGYSTSYGTTTGSETGLGTGDQVTVTLTGLPISTLIYCRVVGDSGSGRIGYSATTFTTQSPSAPTCSTQAASDVGSSSATLRGIVTNDGGVPCNFRFAWGLNTSYGNYTSWETGKITSDTVSTLLTGLDSPETYHYRAVVNNSAGESYGSDAYFTTVFTAPEGVSATAVGPTIIEIKWELAGDQVGVFAKAGSFPVDRLDGEQVYFGTSTGVTHSNLVPGTTYFYRAWSWSEGGNWSTGYSEDAATTPYTLALVLPGDADLTDPNMPSQWFQEPNGSALSNWPGYDLVEQSATDSGIPSGSMWMILSLVLCAVFGIVTWNVTQSPIFVIAGISVAIAIASLIGPVPFWMVLVFLVIAIGGKTLLSNQS
jgi:hypothetical protein